MKAVIDTSSLVALVRYYLPFDKDNSLKKFIEAKIIGNELIVIDEVVVESSRFDKGLVLKALDFLSQKQLQTKSTHLFPDTKFFNMLENQFCVPVQRNKLSSIELEHEKQEYLKSADAKLILYCLKDRHTLEIDSPILVTEETKSENDKKLFKKIPTICEILEIESCPLPTLFKDHFKLNLSGYLR